MVEWSLSLFMKFHGVNVVPLLLINLGCVGGFPFSKMIKEQCILHGLPYYETSYERDKVLAEFLSEQIK